MKRFLFLLIILSIGILSACNHSAINTPKPTTTILAAPAPELMPDFPATVPKFIKPTKEYYEKGERIEVEIDYSTHLLSQTKKLYFSWDIFRAQAMQYDEASGQYIAVDSFPDRYPFTASDDPYGGAVVFLPEQELYEEGRIYPVRCSVFTVFEGRDLQSEIGECTLFLIAENGGYRVSGRDYTDEELNWLVMSEEERKANVASRKEWLSHDGETRTLGDLDGDGKDDVLRTERTDAESAFTLLLSGGCEIYLKDQHYLPKVDSADLDSDSNKEIVVLLDYGGNSILCSNELVIFKKQGEGYVQLPLPEHVENGQRYIGFPYSVRWEKGYSVTISLEETAFKAQTLVDKEKETHLYNFHEEQGPYSGKTYSGTVYKFEIVTFEGKNALKIYQAIAAPNDKESLGACATVFHYEGRTPKAMASEFTRWEP